VFLRVCLLVKVAFSSFVGNNISFMGDITQSVIRKSVLSDEELKNLLFSYEQSIDRTNFEKKLNEMTR
jgi:hypothetical protein